MIGVSGLAGETRGEVQVLRISASIVRSKNVLFDMVSLTEGREMISLTSGYVAGPLEQSREFSRFPSKSPRTCRSERGA